MGAASGISGKVVTDHCDTYDSGALLGIGVLLSSICAFIIVGAIADKGRVAAIVVGGPVSANDPI